MTLKSSGSGLERWTVEDSSESRSRAPGRDDLQKLEQLSRIQAQMRLQLHEEGHTNLEYYRKQIPDEFLSAWMPELVLHDVELRRSVGQSVTLDEYLLRYPEHPEWTHLACQLLEYDLRPGGSSISSDSPTWASDVPWGKGEEAEHPVQIGRYRIDRPLGHGGFGRVYLAHDTERGSAVALKIPRLEKWKVGRYTAAYLQEAVRAAQMSREQHHPGVVRILATFEHDALPVIVMDYVEGQDLSQRLQARGGRLPVDECLVLLRKLCAILQSIHQAHCIHRDLKPRNILLDKEDNPWLTDFGISCLESERLSLSNPSAGTLKYMAPEQINEETTKLGPHTDVWSFGVIMYEMLSGQLPFQGSRSELRQLILAGEPWSLRSRDAEIPERLAEICHKCLRNSLQDRYRDMAAVAADLDQWLRERQYQQVAESSRSRTDSEADSGIRDGLPGSVGTRLVPRPRGLQSYDEQDRDTFLNLIPGEMEPDGLPASLHYWLTRLDVVPLRGRYGDYGVRNLERSDVSKTQTERFSVGVIHGGSGCGKTSFVKAGLLPLLPPEVHQIYLEATPEETELELLKALRKYFPGISADESGALELPQAFRQLREGKGLPAGERLLIVLDQFEQWLHANAAETGSQLALALRHCEGGRLQVLLLVREEYWSAIQEFIRQLDIRLDTHWNDQCLQWFGKAHATKVLGYFGQSLGKLPLDVSRWSPEQRAFTASAVEALGRRQAGKVVPVQLAIFAELFRDLEWTDEELKRQGGTEGIGTRFLMQVFSEEDAREDNRRHRDAAMRLLEELLPSEGQDIRGHRRPESDLQQACGYSADPVSYRQLVDLLERKLKLIASRDPILEIGPMKSGPSYLLTHDFLVPSIRAWVEVELGRTAAGRALALLRKRQKTYADRREKRQLPSLPEWIFIGLFTRRARWTDQQRLMMSVAAQTHFLRYCVAAAIVFLATLFAFKVIAQRDAQSSVDKLTRAGAEELGAIFIEIDSQRSVIQSLLRNLLTEAEAEGRNAERAESVSKTLLHARLALAGWETSHLEWLLEQLLEKGDLEYIEPIRTRLQPYAADVGPRLISVLRNPQQSESRRFRAALGLVGLPGYAQEDRWTPADLALVSGHLTSLFSEYQPLLRRLLKPIGQSLVPSLDTCFDLENASSDQQINAAMALNDFGGDNLPRMTQLVTRSTPRQMTILYPGIENEKDGVVRDLLLHAIGEQPGENMRQRDRVQLGRRRANAAIALLLQGERSKYFEIFRVKDDPEAISQFIVRCPQLGVTAMELWESLKAAQGLRSAATGADTRDTAHILYALIMTLGNYPLEDIPETSRGAVLAVLTEFFEQDPAAVVHSASGWLLRHWGQTALVEQLDQREVPYDPTGKRNWFRMRLELRPNLNPPMDVPHPKQIHSLTFVVFPAGTYHLGSPDFEGGEEDRDRAEVPRVATITRPVAVCDRETTFALFDLFDGGAWRKRVQNDTGWELTGDSPACSAIWFQWVDFCRWLTSECYGADEAWQCHPGNELVTIPGTIPGQEVAVAGKMRPERGGFRMPTESEWELAARGGQSTAYAFGGDVELLVDYGWYDRNAMKRPHPTAKKRPTISGLYDAHGNLYEWTFDRIDQPQLPSLLVDFLGSEVGNGRILRGGSWPYAADRSRSAYRDDDDPYSSGSSFGFRLALTPSELPVRIKGD